MTARRLVVLGAGPAQLGAFRAARRLGVETIACDRDADALALRLGLADLHEQVSTFDADGIERVVRTHAAGGVIAPGTDGPVRVAAEVAARLGLAHPLAPDAAALTTDKRAQRAALAAAGIAQPAVIEAGEPWSGPVVVKPSVAQGQRGLRLVEQPGDLASALEHARAVSRDGEALVEQFVAGDEVTVNAFLYDGFHRGRRHGSRARLGVRRRDRAPLSGTLGHRRGPGCRGRLRGARRRARTRVRAARSRT